MKVSAVLKLIEDEGWQLARTRGSQRQYKHPTQPGLVTVPGKPSDELHPKTLSSIVKQGSIVKQAGLRNDTGRTGEAAERGNT